MKSAFKFKNRELAVNLCVRDLIGLRATAGQVGIEVEVEGNKFPKTDPDSGGKHKLIPKEWSYHHDGSLRGQDNAEYVLAKPLPFDEVPDAVHRLWGMFDDYGTVLSESNRTSVHVHLNVQEFFLDRLCSFIALYMSVEELLTQWCGEHRVGNLFCLRGKDAPLVLHFTKRFLTHPRGRDSFPESFHYAGLNLHALCKLGSLEVRTMRGAMTPETIIRWVEVLRHIYDLSAQFKDPRDICSQFSGRDVREYAELVLGQHCNTILAELNIDADTLRTSLLDGIRIAQDLCYCRDWSEYKPTVLAKDPFDRKPAKVLKNLSAMTAPPPPPTANQAQTPQPTGGQIVVGTQWYSAVDIANLSNLSTWVSSPDGPEEVSF